MQFGLLLVLFSSIAFSLPQPLTIARHKTSRFLSEGTLVGGSYEGANLEAIRFSFHPNEGYERWVVDFSDLTSRATGKIAPRFQIRYIKSSRIESTDGLGTLLIPPKFILTFQGIKQNYLEREKIKKAVKKSKFLRDIVLYPSIENGDLAIELLLKDSVIFEAHQPKEREGRLVIDMKNAPL